jgi:hypothetical protein
MFPEIFIKKRVKYKVIPMGINTTMPAIKLLRNLAKKDFLFGFVINLRITRVYNKNNY